MVSAVLYWQNECSSYPVIVRVLGPARSVIQELAWFAGHIAILRGWGKGDILILVSLQGVLRVVLDRESPWKEYAPHLRSRARSSAVRSFGLSALIKDCSPSCAILVGAQEVVEAASVSMLL